MALFLEVCGLCLHHVVLAQTLNESAPKTGTLIKDMLRDLASRGLPRTLSKRMRVASSIYYRFCIVARTHVGFVFITVAAFVDTCFVDLQLTHLRTTEHYSLVSYAPRLQ